MYNKKMSMNYDIKDLVNMVYNRVVTAALTIGYAGLSKSVFKMNMDLDKFSAKNVAKVAGVVTAAVGTKNMLHERGILPETIMK